MLCDLKHLCPLALSPAAFYLNILDATSTEKQGEASRAKKKTCQVNKMINGRTKEEEKGVKRAVSSTYFYYYTVYRKKQR